ncbi:MAG: hypothetical protein MMC33_002352 [Icmadophila ericetorum]|nr:hypothetical protein [Icmadophila ericetorum]
MSRPVQRRWLPREAAVVLSTLNSTPIRQERTTADSSVFLYAGLTADVLQSLVKNTLLNPALTLPLYILSSSTERGYEWSLLHPTALRRLRVLCYLSLARWLNSYLTRRSLSNWTSDKWVTSQELAVVTGGSTGIGKHMVLSLASKGLKVVILDVQAPTYDLPTKSIAYIPCDLSIPASISQAVVDIRSTPGLSHPTILVLNAGIGFNAPLISIPDSLLEKQFNVNILSHFRLVRHFLPDMIKKNHGMIVTMASLSAYITPPLIVPYACTKSASLSFHEGLAAELVTEYKAPKVRTLCVCPSWANTGLVSGLQVKDKFLSPILEPETIAEAVVERIMRQEGGVLYMPKIHSWYGGSIRGWPDWVQTIVRKGAYKQTSLLTMGNTTLQQTQEQGVPGADPEENLEEKEEVVVEAVVQEEAEKSG